MTLVLPKRHENSPVVVGNEFVLQARHDHFGAMGTRQGPVVFV